PDAIDDRLDEIRIGFSAEPVHERLAWIAGGGGHQFTAENFGADGLIEVATLIFAFDFNALGIGPDFAPRQRFAGRDTPVDFVIDAALNHLAAAIFGGVAEFVLVGLGLAVVGFLRLGRFSRHLLVHLFGDQVVDLFGDRAIGHFSFAFTGRRGTG